MITKYMKNKFDSRLFTYEQLRGMFLPLLLDQLFIFGIGIISTMLVARSEEGAVTAMNMGSVLGNLSYALFSAIAIGGGIVIARAKGANDPKRIRSSIAQTCVVCLLCGTILGLVSSVFGRAVVEFLYPDKGAHIHDLAGEYLKWFGLSIIPYSLFQVVFTTFRSLGDTKRSLWLTLIINSVYLIGSIIFINYLHMSAAGAALSFLTARIVGMIAAIVMLMLDRSLGMKFGDFKTFDKDTLKDIFVLGIPLSIEQLLFQGGMVLVQIYLNKLPNFQTDANGIANSIFMLYYVFAYSLQTISSTVCGQCIGAKDIDLTRKYCKNIITVGRYIMVFAIIILMPITPLLMQYYAPSAEAVPYIWKALLIGALPMPIIWCDGFVTASATRAAGDASYTTIVSLLAFALGRMGTGYLFTIQLGMGVTGIWLGQMIEWIIRAILLDSRLNGTKWIKVDLA